MGLKKEVAYRVVCDLCGRKTDTYPTGSEAADAARKSGWDYKLGPYFRDWGWAWICPICRKKGMGRGEAGCSA